MYARGHDRARDTGFLAEMYSVDVSPDLISRVTDEVMSEVSAWQSTAPGAHVPGHVLRRTARQDPRGRGGALQQAVYLALGVLPDGTRDILGIWIENTEGAKFWMKVFNDLKTRGCMTS